MHRLNYAPLLANAESPQAFPFEVISPLDKRKEESPHAFPSEVIPPRAGEMSAQPTKGARLREKKGDRRTAVDEVESSLFSAF